MKTPIGYWYSTRETQYPNPVENSATDEQVLLMLKTFMSLTKDAELVSYRGVSTCRICGKLNGTREFQTENNVIPVGLIHYITEHKVLVPELL